MGNNGANPAIDVSQYGVGGTFQSKNNVWLNANAVSGTNNNVTASSLGFAVGYAFQFFGDEQQGFQVIPHVNFSTQNGDGLSATGATTGTQYVYGLGVKPEYRLLNSLKVAVDLNLLGTQSSANGTDTQIFAFSVTPGIQYDISKTVMLGLDYNYAAPFNDNANTYPNGLSTVTAKVGYLF
jgi:opacity protein-like surface antigen